MSAPAVLAVLRERACMNFIPPEVLDIIFSYIFPTFRVRILSLVSKRWHTAVMRSIKDPLPRHFDRALVFPQLTSLALLNVWLDPPSRPLVTLPATLRKLRISHEWEWITGRRVASPCFCARARHLTSLQELNVMTGPCTDQAISDIARRNRTSLTTLRLQAKWDMSPEALDCAQSLLGLTYPSLTRAQIAGGHKIAEHVHAFLLVHAARLRKLEFDEAVNFQPLVTSMLEFSRLQKLRVRVDSLDYNSASAIGNLRSLHLQLDTAISNETLELIAPALRSLTLPRLLQDSGMQILSSCSRLKSLEIPAYGKVPPAVAMRLRSISKCPNNPALLWAYTNLTSLVIDIEQLQEYVALAELPKLPHLCDASFHGLHFTLDGDTDTAGSKSKGLIRAPPLDFPRFAAFINQFLAASPRIVRLEFYGTALEAVAYPFKLFLAQRAKEPTSLRTVFLGVSKRACIDHGLFIISPWLELIQSKYEPSASTDLAQTAAKAFRPQHQATTQWPLSAPQVIPVAPHTSTTTASNSTLHALWPSPVAVAQPLSPPAAPPPSVGTATPPSPTSLFAAIQAPTPFIPIPKAAPQSLPPATPVGLPMPSIPLPSSLLAATLPVSPPPGGAPNGLLPSNEELYESSKRKAEHRRRRP